MLAVAMAVGTLCNAAATGKGQKPLPRNMLHTNKLDTLTLIERWNLRTDAVGWLTMTPNIGVEWTLGSHNWNRWTIGVSARTMWATVKQPVPYTRHYLRQGRAEVRRYSHGSGLARSWFVGVYGGYTDFDYKLSTTGYYGDGLIGGLTAGTIAPLYGYRNGSSIDLEVQLNAGVLWANTGEFECAEGRQYYIGTRARKRRLVWNALPLVANTDVLRVAFVYHFGPSVADRFRPRAAIDEQFRYRQNELALQRDSAQQAMRQERDQRRDSLEAADYERRFERQRLELERMHQRDSLARVKQNMKHEK